MLKKKIKIKKTRTSDLYERRRKNKQSYTTKDEDEEEFEKDEMIKVTFYENNKDDKKGIKQIQNKEILEEDDNEDNNDNNNDNNDNINYEKNKDNIVTKKFIDATGRVINDEKDKKDKNNVIKDKKVYSEIKKIIL